MGKNDLIQRLVKDVSENILEGEIEEHLGRNKYEGLENIDSKKGIIATDIVVKILGAPSVTSI